MSLIDTIFAWLELPTSREQRHFLEEHLELLDLRSDEVIHEIMAHYQPVQPQDLLDHLTLLHDARARGKTAAAIRGVYVNLYGGFTLDLPPWLEAVEQQLEELDISASSAAERVSLLDRALVRAQADTAVLPETLAELQKELGKAWYEYTSLERDERIQALETALNYYRAVLETYTYDSYPYSYAKVHINLGDAYSDRVAGKQRDNLEEAITCYRVALQTYTLDRFPEYYAMAQNNLGGAYASRIAGERRTNLESAIACYQAALQVYTLEGYPEDHAMAQGNLGSLYAERIEGGRKNNLEQAIACYEAALQAYTLDTSPEDYAHSQVRLGDAYSDRISGERKANIERAIACYTEALGVYASDTLPVDYARTQMALGIAYSYRIAGERRANLEQALACYGAAAQVYTYEAFPLAWAAVQNGLGNIYRERIAGSPRANLEQAIACYESALRVYTYEDSPEEWAATQRGLGSAYSSRIAGESRTNLEQAIACCERALAVYTYEAFPYDWAITQNGLGTVYRDRIAGERESNLEQAITCFEAALRVFIHEAFPLKWADTNNNLGSTYLNRIGGERRENLEEAIRHCEAALQVYSRETLPLDWADTQSNRGNAYAQRIEGARRANLEQALACYEAALQVYTRRDFPVNYAMIQNNLGIVYSRRAEGGRQANLMAATTCCIEALDIYTLEAFPYEHWQTQLNFALVAAELGHWEQMHRAYEQAYAAEELLVRLGTGVVGRDAILREGRNAAARHAYALIRLGQEEKAAVVIERGRARGLSEALTLDATDPELIQDTEKRQRYIESRQALREAQAMLNRLLTLRANDSELRRISLEYTETYHQARVTFEKVVAEIRAAKDPADFLVEALDQTTLLRAAERGGVGHALLYLAATPGGGIAVAGCFKKSAATEESFIALDLPELTEVFVRELIRDELEGPGQPVINSFSLAQSGRGFEQLLRDWQGDTFRERAQALHEACAIAGRISTLDQAAQGVLDDPQLAGLVTASLDQLSSSDLKRLKRGLELRLLQHELKRCLEALAEVALRPLVTWLIEKGVRSCSLIPCGWLAAFPLMAAEIFSGQAMAEILAMSVAPNARSLLRDRNEASPRAGIYALGNPEPRRNPLPWGEAEALALLALARQLNLSGEVQVQEKATRRWLIKGLQKGYVVSASCHGLFDLKVPLQSALILARGERLTLGEMLNREESLRGLRLLVLSACQTAILDLEGAREEVRSLAAGMLQAGADAVLASLWPVDDMATFLLMTGFAQEWLPNLGNEPPAAALARAQRWLRLATNAELLCWHVKTFSPPTSEEQQEAFSLSLDAKIEADKLILAGAGFTGWSHERGTRYPFDEAEDHLHEQVRQGRPDVCPFADPIYWAGFQITGW